MTLARIVRTEHAVALVDEASLVQRRLIRDGHRITICRAALNGDVAERDVAKRVEGAVANVEGVDVVPLAAPIPVLAGHVARTAEIADGMPAQVRPRDKRVPPPLVVAVGTGGTVPPETEAEK